MERRLTAILAADVVGYSRLMGEDETGTLERLKSLRKELVQPKITERKGRIVKLVGDGLLAEFPSVVEAVQCAVDIQKSMIGRETDLPGEQRIRLRIGVNLGDIIVEGSDIYGDGVNVAARLEALADPGGICISGTAFETVYGKLDLAFEDMGEQQVKNITKPVRVYRLASGSQQNSPSIHSAEPLPLPDKPSIAVLPFTNMSGDPEQEYFSDGITEDIITELSRFRSLFVIARNSSFHYKGRSPRIQDVGRELGVHYVVEGSVRRAGNRVRITAQLIDAVEDKHIWAERYDRELEDIFAVQDEVTHAIVATIEPHLASSERQRARRKPTINLSAYDYLLRGEWYERKSFFDSKALDMWEKAVAIDPACARAYGHMANFYLYDVFVTGMQSEETVQRAHELAEKALSINEDDGHIQSTASIAYLLVGRHELAKAHSERAMALNPNDVYVIYCYGLVMTYLGDPDVGLEWYRLCQRLDPYEREALFEDWIEAYYMSRQYEMAIETFDRWRNPPFNLYPILAACYAQIGRIDGARAAAAQYESERPKSHDLAGAVAAHLRMCARPEDRDHWLEGYRKAGFAV